jgi:hypothetical protein
LFPDGFVSVKKWFQPSTEWLHRPAHVQNDATRWASVMKVSDFTPGYGRIPASAANFSR